VTGKEVRCQDCSRGTYYDLPGSNSSQTCKPTPSGFFCNLLGQTDCFKRILPSGQTTNCKECQEGFLCPAGTSEYIDSMKCPAGFYCGLGTYSGILFGTQPGDKPGSRFFKEIADDCLEIEFKSVQFEKTKKVSEIRAVYEQSTAQKPRESGVCPQKFYCPRGTLKTQREQSSCPRNHYCPAGSMTGVPCPPGTKSDSQKGSIDDCVLDKNWLKYHGDRVISISPTTTSKMELDPYAYMQDSTSRDTSNPANWNNMPILNPTDTTFSYAIQTLQVAHFRFNFSKALFQGLVYDIDYRIALYVDDFPVIDYDTLVAAGPDSRYEPLFQSSAGLATGGEDKVSKFDINVIDFHTVNPSLFPYKRWTDTWDTAMKALDGDYGGKKERRTFGETCRYDNDCSWCLIGMPVPKINANKYPNECRFDSELDPFSTQPMFNQPSSMRLKSPVGCTVNMEPDCYVQLDYMGSTITQRKIRTMRQMMWQQPPWNSWQNMLEFFDINKDAMISYKEIIGFLHDASQGVKITATGHINDDDFNTFAGKDSLLEYSEYLNTMSRPALTSHCNSEVACCGGNDGNWYTDRCSDEMSADIRVNTPEDFRLEQTVSSRQLCLNWCKNIKNEHLKSRDKQGIMFTEDGSAFEIPPVGIDIGRPCRTAKAGTSINTRSCQYDKGPLQGSIVKRYGLPQTMRQVTTQGGTTKLSLTPDVYEQLLSTGLIHITAFARRNCTIILEIELLNGKYYSQSFQIFSQTMSWVVEHPQSPLLSGDTIYDSFIAIYNSFIFTWSLPLNLHNHYNHDSEPLNTAGLMYVRDYTDEHVPNEHALSKGPHKILLGSLIMKSAASYTPDVNVQKEMDEIAYNDRLSKRAVLSTANEKEWKLMKSLQHDPYLRGYNVDMQLSPSSYQLGSDDPVSKGTTRLVDDIKKTASAFWTGGMSHVTLPYMPYVSNCAGYDSYVPLWKLFQNSEQCLFRYPNETTTTEQFDLLSPEKTTDYCDVRLHCRYEEDVTRGDGARSYWFESRDISFLFFFSRYQMKNYEFGGPLKAMGTAINEKKESEEVNRLVSYEDDQLERYQLFHAVPVTPMKGKVIINEEVIRTGKDAAEEPVEDQGPRSFPKLVHMVVEFWQKKQDEKEIARAKIYFSDYRSSASYTSAKTNDDKKRQLEYIFRTTFRHLDYLGLLDNFSLPSLLYCLISIVVGVLITLMFFALWYALLKSKRFNSVIPHPQLDVSSGLFLIGIPAMAGFGYAFIPTFLVIILLQVILHKTFLGPLLFDNVKGNAYYFGETSEMVVKTIQQGRMGLSYTLLGIFIIIAAANVTNPLELKEKKTVRKKNLWRRSQVLFYTIIFIFFQTIMITISRT
jgi:hypothetical protein